VGFGVAPNDWIDDEPDDEKHFEDAAVYFATYNGRLCPGIPP